MSALGVNPSTETMMEEAEQPPSEARAARIHDRIEQLKAKGKAARPNGEPGQDESPREYVQRRMHELDESQQAPLDDPPRDN